MWFYAFGSLLFILAMLSAISVMASDFARYRHAMIAALRTLSLSGLDTTPANRQAVLPVTPAKAPRLSAAA